MLTTILLDVILYRFKVIKEIIVFFRLVALTRKCHVQMPRLGSKKIRRIESLKVV